MIKNKHINSDLLWHWPSQGIPHPDASDPVEQEGEQEALIYVAGWVTKKVAEEPDLGQCWECERVLVRRNNTEHNYNTATREGSFIMAKKFHASASLHEPSEAFQACIARCESIIKRELPRAWAAKGLAQRVKVALQLSGAFDGIHLQHPIHSKAIEAIALNKFVMCRLGAEIRARNQVAAQIKKRNEKNSRKRKCLNINE